VNALVVYESLWGNTSAIAHAIAEGIGDQARVCSTTEAPIALAAGADLIVGGAPLMGFSLPTESMHESVGSDAKHRAHPPDVAHPPIRSWLQSMPKGSGFCAGFETRIWWSPGSAAKKITKLLQGAGYTPVAAPEKFVVTGTYGPLKDGELERAKVWGATLAKAVQEAQKAQ
jgi:hypothetical protein